MSSQRQVQFSDTDSVGEPSETEETVEAEPEPEISIPTGSLRQRNGRAKLPMAPAPLTSMRVELMSGLGQDAPTGPGDDIIDLFPEGFPPTIARNYRRRGKGIYEALKLRFSADISQVLANVVTKKSSAAGDRSEYMERQRRQKSVGAELVRNTHALQILGVESEDRPCSLSAIDAIIIWHQCARDVLTATAHKVVKPDKFKSYFASAMDDVLNRFQVRHGFGTFLSVSAITQDDDHSKHTTTMELETLLSELWNLAQTAKPDAASVLDQVKNGSGNNDRVEFGAIMKAVYIALLPEKLDKDLIEDGVRKLWLHLATDDNSLPVANFFVAVIRTVELFSHHPQDIEQCTRDCTSILQQVIDGISTVDEETGLRSLKDWKDMTPNVIATRSFPLLPGLEALKTPIAAFGQYLKDASYVDQLDFLQFRNVGGIAAMAPSNVKSFAASMPKSVDECTTELRSALMNCAGGDLLLPELMKNKMALPRFLEAVDDPVIQVLTEYAMSINLDTIGDLAMLDINKTALLAECGERIDEVRHEILRQVDLISRVCVFPRLRRSIEPLRVLLRYQGRSKLFAEQWASVIEDLVLDDPEMTVGDFCHMDVMKEPFSSRGELVIRELRRTLIAHMTNSAKQSPYLLRSSRSVNNTASLSSVDLTSQVKSNLDGFFDAHLPVGGKSPRTPRESARFLELTVGSDRVSPQSLRAHAAVVAAVTPTAPAREIRVPDPDEVPRMAIPGFPSRHLPSSSQTPRGSPRAGGRYEVLQSLEERMQSTVPRPQSSIPTFHRLPGQEERVPLAPKTPPAIPKGTPRLRPRTAGTILEKASKSSITAKGDHNDQVISARRAIRKKVKRSGPSKKGYVDDANIEYLDGVEPPTPRRLHQAPRLPRGAERLRAGTPTTPRNQPRPQTAHGSPRSGRMSPRTPATPRAPTTPRPARPSTAPISRHHRTYLSDSGVFVSTHDDSGVEASSPEQTTKSPRTRRPRRKKKPKSENKVKHLDNLGRRKEDPDKKKNPYAYSYQDPTKTTTLNWMKNFSGMIQDHVFSSAGSAQLSKKEKRRLRKKGQYIDYAAKRRLNKSRLISGPKMEAKSYGSQTSRKRDVYMPSDIRQTDQVVGWL